MAYTNPVYPAKIFFATLKQVAVSWKLERKAEPESRCSGNAVPIDTHIHAFAPMAQEK